MKRIGTVEILRDRVYPHDGSTVFVEPGEYPLFRDGDDYFWEMTGCVNRRREPHFESLGVGMFLAAPAYDDPTDVEVTFPSPRFGPKAFADLLAESGFTEGHPEQRLRVTVDGES